MSLASRTSLRISRAGKLVKLLETRRTIVFSIDTPCMDSIQERCFAIALRIQSGSVAVIVFVPINSSTNYARISGTGSHQKTVFNQFPDARLRGMQCKA
jgi:hypothetical protein